MLKPFLLATAFAILSAKPFANAYAPCATGQDEMSVEGIGGIFCVTGPICMGDTNTGACPNVQEGLPYGSYCGLVRTGVYGCKVLTADMIPTSAPSTTAPAPTTATPAPTTATPAPTTATPAPTTTSPVPTTSTPSTTPTTTVVGACPSGSSPVSVEGVPGIFCSLEPVCMGTTTDSGHCPVAQDGLPNGSYCGTVASGVFGCKAGTSSPASSSSAPVTTSNPTASPTPTTTVSPTPTSTVTPTPSSTVAPTPTSTVTPTPAPTSTSSTTIGSCGSGSSPISVEGVPGIFCAQEPICMGTTSDSGSCPVPQSGLPDGSYCGRVASGVFGCKVGKNPTASTTTPTTTPTTSTSAPPTTQAPVATTQTPATTTSTPAPTSTPSSTSPSTAGVIPTISSNGKCPTGSSPISVEGVNGNFCAQEPVCMGTTTNTGSCPAAQPGLLGGSYCGKVASGVFGCKPGSAPTGAAATAEPKTPLPLPASQCPAGNSPVTVEGALGVFCVAEPVCVGTTTNTGACPSIREGLPTGSHCGVVASGVFGCKAGPASIADAAVSAAPVLPAQCAPGSSPVSVEGALGVFCVAEPVCSGRITDSGSCPAQQGGLPTGSHCGIVASGVYGCKVGSASSATTSPAAPVTTTPTSSTTTPATSTPATTTPTTTTPTTTTPTTTTSAPTSTSPVSSAPTTATVATGNGCAAGSNPVSVEGAPGVFCVAEPVCAGTITNTGSCPGEQSTLPTGSYCTIVSSGVYGCKVGGSTSASTTAVTFAPAATPTATPISTPTATTTSTPTPAATNATATSTGTCPSGYSPISVQGRNQIFCAPDPICMGTTTDSGSCPTAQDGLEFGSYCTMIETGVYGCRPNDY